MISKHIRSICAFIVFALLCYTFLFSNIASASTNLVSFGQANIEALQTKQAIRIISWNTHKFEGYKAYQDVYQMLKQTDLLLLQESLMNNFAKDFFNYPTREHETYGAISFRTSSGGDTGVSTSSRIKTLNSLPITSIETEPILNTPKMILVTEYKIKDSTKTLMVANIHGLNFVPNWKFSVQLGQLEEILAPHQGPIIFAGDFNTHNIEKVHILVQMATRLKLNHVAMANESSILHLDHIYMRGLKVRSARVLTKITSSDHLPILAELELIP